MTRVGIDTGGTFTDFIWRGEDGQLVVHKVSSTPTDPSAAILAGLERTELRGTSAIIHGTTVATNALLERKGARTALVTTAGFSDLLAIGRQDRPDLYALVPNKPAPLVPAERRFGVHERIGADGRVLIPVDAQDLAEIAESLRAYQVEAVAICFLFAHVNSAHERAVATALDAMVGRAGLFFSYSADVLPEYREYERMSATVINAYVGPVMQRYLGRLAASVAPRPLAVMQSSGGIIGADEAGSEAARTCLSGPAGGVVGARRLALQAGFERIITLDMGGTSTDVALCNGETPTTTRGQIAGFPLPIPMVDIHTVGAGGGSLAGIDPGGALYVGPGSAGAWPGPAAYGRGGSQPTVTDANLVAGRLDPTQFLGGSMPLDEDASRAVLERLAHQGGIGSAKRMAAQILRVADAVMERAVRNVSIGRGHDPRVFTLVPFGGAGPLHACALAQRLQIPRVLITPFPGALSAYGLLVAPAMRDYSSSMLAPLTPTTLDRVRAAWSDLAAIAVDALVLAGEAAESLSFAYGLDCRYVGQSHELLLPCRVDMTYEDLTTRWHARHRQRFSFALENEPIEIVTARLRVYGPEPPIEAEATQRTVGQPRPSGRRDVWFDDRAVPTSTYRRRDLTPGDRLTGPALVFQYDTTTVVPPKWDLSVDSWRNLILTDDSADRRLE